MTTTTSSVGVKSLEKTALGMSGSWMAQQSHPGLSNEYTQSQPFCVPQDNYSMLPSHIPYRKPPTIHTRKMSPDNRRNLYVLGLPFSLTKHALDEQFSRFGTVSHSVILATVDNNSRRRGFVVMSCHDEAAVAMKALSGSQLNGHILDVSWAVIQRSKGFLDGGDRATMIDAWSSELPSPQDQVLTPSPTCMVPVNTQIVRPEHPSLVFPATSSTLVVANLPTLLFSQSSDLDPLFLPYGRIKSTTITASNENVMTVVVEYDTVVNATEAAKSLQNQVYAGRALVVQFATPPDPMPQSSLCRTPIVHTPEPAFTVIPQNLFNTFPQPRYQLPSHCDPSLLPFNYPETHYEPLAPLRQKQEQRFWDAPVLPSL